MENKAKLNLLPMKNNNNNLTLIRAGRDHTTWPREREVCSESVQLMSKLGGDFIAWLRIVQQAPYNH